jgi:hypothetical protein
MTAADWTRAWMGSDSATQDVPTDPTGDGRFSRGFDQIKGARSSAKDRR